MKNIDIVLVLMLGGSLILAPIILTLCYLALLIFLIVNGGLSFSDSILAGFPLGMFILLSFFMGKGGVDFIKDSIWEMKRRRSNG